MKKVEYSQIVRNKLKKLKEQLVDKFGTKVAKKNIDKILQNVESLAEFEEMGVLLSSIYNIECDYRILHTQRNYLIYRVELEKVIIVEMFDERENFMYKLFGIQTLLKDDTDYWDD